MQRMRFTYTKGESLKWVGHLDLARMWERVLRRSGLPAAYTQGFNPQLRIQFASALPVGCSGLAELADLWLGETVTPAAFEAALRPKLPPGVEVRAAHEVELHAPTLQALMFAAVYNIQILLPSQPCLANQPDASIYTPADSPADSPADPPADPPADLPADPPADPPAHATADDDMPDRADVGDIAAAVASFLALTHVPRRRSRDGKVYDLRPLVEEMAVTGADAAGWVHLTVRLASRPGATGRPDELLESLGLGDCARRIERTQLILASAPVPAVSSDASSDLALPDIEPDDGEAPAGRPRRASGDARQIRTGWGGLD